MKKHIILLLLTSFALFSSCKKDSGCTDSNAVNYSSGLDEDDGSCTYQADTYFYYNFFSKQDFAEDGISMIELSVNDEFIGVMPTDLSSGFGCGSSSSVTKTLDLGSSRVKNYTLAVRDQSTNTIIYSREFQVIGGTCNPIIIDYSN